MACQAVDQVTKTVSYVGSRMGHGSRRAVGD